MKQPITYGSLFSGIEGFGLGLGRAGMECVFQVEQDRDCLDILSRHWPHVPKFTDIREFNASSIAVRPSWLCGGFPCQDLSVAGRRAGLAGERSGLFFEFMRVIREFTPAGVLIENVPGLLSGCGCPLCRVVSERMRQHLERERESNPMARDCGCGECEVGKELHQAHSGRNFAIVMSALVELGYGVASRVLDSQWLGIAQRRRRVFIVGCFGNVRRACEILFEPESLPWDSPPSRDDESRNTSNSSRFAHGEDHPVIAFGTKDYGQDAAFDESPTLRAMMHDKADANGGGQVSVVYGFKRGQGAKARSIGFKKEESPTLTSSDSGTQQYPGVLIGEIVRRITPLEEDRLQGFPDDHTRFGADGKEIRDSSRYRMCGNAVAVPVAEWIGKRIMRVIQ